MSLEIVLRFGFWRKVILHPLLSDKTLLLHSNSMTDVSVALNNLTVLGHLLRNHLLWVFVVEKATLKMFISIHSDMLSTFIFLFHQPGRCSVKLEVSSTCCLSVTNLLRGSGWRLDLDLSHVVKPYAVTLCLFKSHTLRVKLVWDFDILILI